MSSSHYGSPSPVPPVNPDVESPPPNVPVSGLGLSGGALPAPTTGPDGPSPIPPVNPDVESPPPNFVPANLDAPHPNVPVSGLGLSGGVLPAPTTGPPDVESPPPNFVPANLDAPHPNVPVSGLGLSGGALPAPTTGPDGPFEDQNGQIFYRNRKRVALRAVLESFATEVVNLGANSTEPKSVTLTEGLGGTDSIWESPAADEAAKSIGEIIDSITRRFMAKTRALELDWENELVFVKQDDPRAYQDY